MRWLIILLLLKTKCQAEEWDANNFPNPTAGQFLKCRMKTTANICDPDGVLSEQARYRLDHDLKQLESRTRQDHGRTFCEKKGVTAAMAVTRHVKGGSIEAVKMMANDILRKWTLDTQCQKAVVFVVSTDDMKFWVARDDRVPVYADEFTEIFEQQKSLFQQSNHQQALTNIMQKTWEKALSKQGSPKAGGGQPGPYPPSGGDSGMMDGGFKGKGGPDFKMPSIPGWFWAALVLVIIPLLCLCICCYCCCCRGKGSAGARAASRGVPMTDDGGMGGGSHRAGGGAGSMFRNIAGSAGGAGIGSLLGNLISGRRARGMGGGGYGGGMGMGGYGGGGYQGGGAYPAAPAIYDDNAGEGGGGLYPSKAVKDQGGGGSWA